LARLRSKLAVDPIPVLTKDAIAGHFTTSSEELGRRVGPFLGGDDLYLFPDAAYLYHVWSDIPPATIRDNGVWVILGDEIVLTPDSDIIWNPGADRRYVLVPRPKKAWRPDFYKSE